MNEGHPMISWSLQRRSGKGFLSPWAAGGNQVGGRGVTNEDNCCVLWKTGGRGLGSGDRHRPGELIVEYEKPDGKVGMKRSDVIKHVSNRLVTAIRAHAIETGKLLNHRFRP